MPGNLMTVTTQFVANTKAKSAEMNTNFSDITSALSLQNTTTAKDINIGTYFSSFAQTTTDYTITSSATPSLRTYIAQPATTTGVTVYLPTASASTGRHLKIMNIGSTITGNVNIQGAAAGENVGGIAGSTGFDLPVKYDYVDLVCDGSI